MDNFKPKLKILYVITQGEWGGAQRYVYDIATHLAGEFDITVAIGERKGKKELENKIKRLKDCKIAILQLKHLVRRISPIHDILAVFELAKLYKTLKPDIIHLNSSKAGITGSLASLFLIPYSLFIVYTVHGWVFNEPNRKLGCWLYRFLERMTARWKNKIIVLSDRDLNDGLKLGIEEKKLVKIQLGINQQIFLDKKTAREKLSKTSDFRLQTSDRVIGTIANLYPSKGLDTLIDAIKILNTSYELLVTNYQLQFIIIGEGLERKNLELRIKNYKLEDTVYLTGAIENAAQYLKAFDLFVLPSRKEGLPYTILEAIAAEIPIVATDVGGIAVLIENTVPPDNPKKLAEAIVAALDNPPPIKNNTLTIEKMMGETEKIYLENKKSL